MLSDEILTAIKERDRGIVMSMRRQVLSFLFFSTMSGLLASMVLSLCMMDRFSQFRAARDQVVNGLVKTATQSAFWVHVRLLEGVVLVPAC